MPPRARPSRARPDRSAPAFTLLETVLATVIGSLVLIAALSLFVAMSRAEATMARASRHMEELALTQQVLRKSMMTMVLAGRDAVERRRDELAEGGELSNEAMVQMPRPRLLLEFDTAPSLAAMRSNAILDNATLLDPAGYGMGPQRFEIVLPDKPVPESMRLFPQAWTTAATDDIIRSFDPSGVERPLDDVGLRGCFELRPDGARERVMEGYGLVPASGLDPRPMTPAARKPPEGWTLWWRPVYGEEYWARQRGEPFDIDRRPTLLAEAVPLIRGIVSLRWSAFAAEQVDGQPDAPLAVQRWPQFAALTVQDIPGYMELEAETTSGTYVSWIFEMGWSLAEESVEETPDETPEPEPEDETIQLTPQGGRT